MKFWPFSSSRSAAKVERKTPPISRRSYAAAGSKLTFADFRGSKGSADYELMNGLAAVREKSRSLARNSGTMRRYFRLLQTNVVGHAGFQYRCRVPKADGTLNKSLNSRVEWAFWRWAKRCSADGRLSLRQIENLIVASWARDGEIFIEHRYGSKYRDGYALNILEADLVDETLNTVYSVTGNQIRMGVEVDEDFRPVAYHVHTQHPGDPGWYHQKNNTKYRRVPADRMTHIYEVLRPGQTRGEPPSASAILGVKMLDGYREAEVTNRRIAASVMGFFRRALPKADQIDAMADRVETESVDEPEFQVEIEPGTFKTMPDGYEFDKFEASGSTTDYEKFEGQVKKDIAMGLNLSNMSLGMETAAVSYSAGRSVLQEDRDYYRSLQSFFIETFADVVIERWVLAHSLQDTSLIPPTMVSTVIEYSSFAGRGWDWVDPSKDVSANSEALRTRQTSLSRIAASRGIDFNDLIDEIAQDERALKDAGLTLLVPDATTTAPQDTGNGQDGNGNPDAVQ